MVDIKDVGQGFFNTDGSLRTGAFGKAQAADEITKSSKVEPPKPTEEAVEADVAGPTRDALRQVRSRTTQQVNAALDTVEGAQDDIQRAKKVLLEQKETLKEIRDFEGKTKDLQKLKDKFERLETERADLSTEIDKNNQTRQDEGSRRISVGNKSFGSFSTEPVEFDQGQAVDLESRKDVRSALSEINDELKGINEQRSAVREVRTQVQSASREALGELSRVSDSNGVSSLKPIESEREAEAVARNTRNDILKQGAKAMEAFNPTAATQKIISNLFS